MSSQFESFGEGDLILDSHVNQFVQPIQDIQSGAAFFSADESTVADLYEVRFDDTGPQKNHLTEASMPNGLMIHFKASSTNTGAAQLKVNGLASGLPAELGIFQITKQGGSPLAAGDIQSGQMIALLFDADFERFEMTGVASSGGSVGPQGPPGAPGADGPKGDKGDQGDTGATGAAGPQGLQGIEGPVGPAGATGPAGAQGEPGVAGPAGPAGAQGDPGATGAQGPAGPAGAEGPAGPQGAAGAEGAQGPQGLQGAQGPQGPAGPAGDEGPVGPQGPPGPSGAQELDGLDDVVLSSPAAGELLRFDGSEWVNAELQASDVPAGIDAANIGAGSVSNTEFGYLANVTSDIQDQLDNIQSATSFAGLSDVDFDSLADGDIPVYNPTTQKWENRAAFSLDSVIPVGTIVPFSGPAVPSGWLLCDGRAVSKGTYSKLWDVFRSGGSTSPYGQNEDFFNLPDLRGRVVAGLDNMGGDNAGRLGNSGEGNPGLNASSLGQAGGLDRRKMTSGQMPLHNHTMPSHSHSIPSHSHGIPNHEHHIGRTFGASLNYGSAGIIHDALRAERAGSYSAGWSGNTDAWSGFTGSFGGTTNNAGSGEFYPNVQPTMVLNYIVFSGILGTMVPMVLDGAEAIADFSDTGPGVLRQEALGGAVTVSPITSAEVVLNWGRWGSAGGNYAANVFGVIPFAIDLHANSAIHSSTVSPTEFTVPRTGVWMVNAKFFVTANLFGSRSAHVGMTVNNATPTNVADFRLCDWVVNGNFSSHLFINEPLVLQAGDIVRFFMRPTGSALALTGGDNGTTCSFTLIGQ